MQQVPDLKNAGFRTIFDRVIRDLVAHQRVRGISLHGSMIYGEQDGHSDVDLDVFVDRTWDDLESFRLDFVDIANSWPPPEASLRKDHEALLEAEWGFRVIGPFLFDLNFEPIASFTEPRIAKILSGELLDTIGMRDLLDGRILYDPRGLIAGYKRRLRDYPESLARRIVGERHRSIRTTYAQAMTAIERGDLLSARHAGTKLAEDAGHLFFALNRTWHPGRKRLLACLGSLPNLPPDLVPQLRQVLVDDLIDSMNRFGRDLERLHRTIESAIGEP